MSKDIGKKCTAKKVFRLIARIIPSIFIAFFLFMLTGESISESEPITWEGIGVVACALVLLAAVVFVWIKGKPGGIALIVCGLAFAVFIFITAGSNKIPASILISSPFWVSGVLLFFSSCPESRKN